MEEDWGALLCAKESIQEIKAICDGINYVNSRNLRVEAFNIIGKLAHSIADNLEYVRMMSREELDAKNEKFYKDNK